HAGDDFSERHEWFGIMRLGVIAQINEYLRGAAIGHGEGVREGAANIRFDARIIWNGFRPPCAGYLRVAVDAELGPAALDDAEESVAIIVTGLNQIIEAVRAVRRPVAMHFNQDDSLAGLKTHFEQIRRAAVHFRRLWIEQRDSFRVLLCEAQSSGENCREQCSEDDRRQTLRGASHDFLSVFRSRRARYFFQSTAFVWLPWPTVWLLSGITIALPCFTRLISRPRIPWSGGLIRSSAELIASNGAVIFSRPGAGS